jgi:ribosomal protein L37E
MDTTIISRIKCPCCDEPFVDRIGIIHGHVICPQCAKVGYKKSGEPCTVCNTPFTRDIRALVVTSNDSATLATALVLTDQGIARRIEQETTPVAIFDVQERAEDLVELGQQRRSSDHHT